MIEKQYLKIVIIQNWERHKSLDQKCILSTMTISEDKWQ